MNLGPSKPAIHLQGWQACSRSVRVKRPVGLDLRLDGVSTPDSDDVKEDGVFRAVLEGYDAVYEGLPRGETFNRLWRLNAYGGDFPEEFAHIGFLTVPEAQRLRHLLQIGGGEVLVDLACGAGGPGLWMAREAGASLIGIDPSAAGLAAARQRAGRVRACQPCPIRSGLFRADAPGRRCGGCCHEHRGVSVCAEQAGCVHRVGPDHAAGSAGGDHLLEVDPAKVQGLPVLGVDPIPDYRPVIAAAGLRVEAYEETPGWQERVYAAFSALLDSSDTLTAEMGDHAVAGAVAEAMVTVQVKPYRRDVAVASHPG